MLEFIQVYADMSGDQYKWEKGRLTEIRWSDTFVNGKLSFSSLKALKRLEIRGNENQKDCITDLAISGCANLKYLDCSMHKLSKLDVSKNVNLVTLGCSWNLSASVCYKM